MINKTDFTKYNAAGFAKPAGLYSPELEHDSCGVGFLAKLDNVPTHDLVKKGLQLMVNLEHRGAIGGDAATGDGAGILVQIPDAFFRKTCKKITFPEPGNYGVGVFFLPSSKKLAKNCKRLIEKVVKVEGCEVLGWRNVPINSKNLGALSKSTMPEIEQLFVGTGKIEKEDFEKRLYIIRKVIEKEAAELRGGDYSQFYPVSLSGKTILYKGMLTGTQLKTFFPDLNDLAFASAFAILHQRYSTNTLPQWCLAQPFRCLAHNGEINTLRGNINRIHGREAQFKSEVFGKEIEKLKPAITEGLSDSAAFDNALEFLIANGRSLPHAAMMMVPEAWGEKYIMSADKRAFYEFHAAIMEPWDGPAALVITDGRFIGSILDRNGLRPARYTITKDGMVIMASETGVIKVKPENIRQRGRLQPGKMFLVDMQQHRIVSDSEIKGKISRRKPYRHWVNENRILLKGLQSPSDTLPEDPQKRKQLQNAFGYTEEELKMVITPMASQGQEAVGSMGNDAAHAVLSNKPRLLFDYFKQLFAQVTNPPIDPLREQLVMSLMSFIGNRRNLLQEQPEDCRQLKLSHPILTPEDVAKIKNSTRPEIAAKVIDITFPAGGKGKTIETSLQKIFALAEKHIKSGAHILILTDKNINKKKAAIPSLLAVAGLHHHLIKKGLRSKVGLIAETGEAREVNHFALLISYGVSAICPYLAFSTVKELAETNMLETQKDSNEAIDAYITAVKKGLLKTLSRMGISTIRSYRGAQIFEALGISKKVIDKYFCGTTSKMSGITLDEIAEEANQRHKRGFPERGTFSQILDSGGEYHLRRGGEKHLFSPEAIAKLQQATSKGDYKIFKDYTKIIDDQSKERATLRSLLKFKKGKPVPIDKVEPVENITKRFVTAAMSFGSISKEAHEAIAIAMNRIGGKSNSGEGGEDPARFKPMKNGDSKRSAIKQIASARFGVTSEYLINCDELQIKMAQGAKPGEGGQLPGHKVSAEIAKTRHTTPGVTLISPPPHHDIYSIEDLAQLIYDLKMANPDARVSVKLVSEVGVGTIAAGVAKAKADMVLISGFDGGTGASPLTSLKHCGLPWELGLAETQQALINNQLRDKIRVQTDGQLKTGRDLAIAALMGAEEFGFGTTVLVTLGCVMMRKCHLNTCPVGVATQDEELRKKFMGKADYVVNFMNFMAQELREYMAMLGFKTVDEMVGHVEMLKFQPAIEHWKAHGLNLKPLLVSPLNKKTVLRCTSGQKHEVHKSLDRKLIRLSMPALEKKKNVVIKLPIKNTDRTVGATLSGEVTKRFGSKGLPKETISINLKGSAGQSLGAFLAPGVAIKVEGDVNDYVGKGLSGGKIFVVPQKKTTFVAEKNVIAGNVALYGATAGELYLNGTAGERFAVRNSGAKAVVEGVGDHGCEYMTGGVVVILGKTGVNFAAGMSGGIAFVYDENELFGTRCNLNMVDLENVWTEEDKKLLKSMVKKHYKFTNSKRAKTILKIWETAYPRFVKVMPIDYKRVLEKMRINERNRDSETISASEEVFV